MAFANTNLLSRLWQNKGLIALLQSQNLPLESSLLFGKAAEPTRPLSSRPQVPQRPAATRRTAATARPASRSSQPQPKPMPGLSVLGVEAWPEIWQTLLQRVKVGRVVWTYPLLGSDLLQQASPGLVERRGFLTRILQDPPVYPPGTHTFWPFQLPKGSAQPEIFWSGVRRLGASVVMILGLEAGQTLLAKTVVPYSQHHAYGCHVMVFQEIQDLIHDLALYGEMRKMLRDILLTIGLRPVR
ncbi:MAG: hypothetical protein K6G15_02130 [Desulfovibrio sp.]|nr:hypothetical protein [Desulfovibrio sp.]